MSCPGVKRFALLRMFAQVTEICYVDKYPTIQYVQIKLNIHLKLMNHVLNSYHYPDMQCLNM